MKEKICKCELVRNRMSDVVYDFLTTAYAVFEVVYFFSLAGTVQGIITPRLFAAFPHYLFWEYFITHTGIVLGALVLIFRYNWKVTWLSLWRAFLWLQVIAFFNLVFDFTFEVNYMFMRNLPRVPSVIDYFGQWPWYIFACEVFGLASFIFYLVPFLVSFFTYGTNSLIISSLDKILLFLKISFSISANIYGEW